MGGTRDDVWPLQPSPLVAAGRLLAERGIYGLVWFDTDLFVSARYGRLSDFVEVGEPLTERCYALVGLEDEIRSLSADIGRLIDLPAVQIVSAERTLPRLNLTIFWHAEGGHFLMLLARATSRSDLEVELSKQMRARLIAEAAVAAKSRELARANRDLEDFAGIVSHDLKAPLRALRYAAEDITALLDAGDLVAARARLDEIAGRTRRMTSMTTALLDYASVGRKADVAETLDTRELIEEVVRSMPVPAGFTVAVTGDWPRLTTVRAALDLVLRNLIDNAVKHHDSQHGAITIEAAPGASELLITVRDDGPGIAPEHHAAVLLPFRTLAAGTGHDGGTGMGLAFVNRTVETIGGRLAIRSNPAHGRGTTFVLGWPLAITS